MQCSNVTAGVVLEGGRSREGGREGGEEGQAHLNDARGAVCECECVHEGEEAVCQPERLVQVGARVVRREHVHQRQHDPQRHARRP